MDDKFKTSCKPKYRLLNEDQIQKIHLASLELLETSGVRISNDEGIKLFEGAGCSVKDNDIILIPSSLVEECIESAPSSIIMYNRKGEMAMRLEGSNNYFGLGTDLIRTHDIETDEIRPSLLKDVANAAKVADYCKDVDFIASFALPSDVPTNLMYINCVKTMMENSIKPIFFTAAGKEDLSFIIEMAEKVAGNEQTLKEKPFLIHYSEPTAPLFHSTGAVNKLLLCAEKRIPICYPPGDILGASCPVTLAGGIMQANAEALSGIVLHQLKNKGAPIISGIGVIPLDMKTSVFCYGAPEFRLTNSAFADIYHHYKIPMWSTVGTDSFTLDPQAAMEHSIATLLSTLDGANLIHDIGYLGQGLLGNPASIVMCDEIISFVKRFNRGFEIDQEKLGMDVIQKVGPSGEFLAEEHTLKHFRSELWMPKYLNRKDIESWLKKGKRSYNEIVIEKTLEILKTHQPEPLSEEILQSLNKIYEKAEKFLIDFQFKA